MYGNENQRRIPPFPAQRLRLNAGGAKLNNQRFARKMPKLLEWLTATRPLLQSERET